MRGLRLGLGIAGGAPPIPPALVLDANIAAETYTLNGVSKTYAQIFNEAGAWILGSGAHVANVGIVANKTVGLPAVHRYSVPFQQVVFDAVQAATRGVTVIIDYTTDNFVDIGLTGTYAYAAIDYEDAAFAHCWYNLYGGVQESTNGQRVGQLFDYDYDTSDFHDLITSPNVPGSLPITSQVLGTFGRVLSQWFPEYPELALTSDQPSPWPNPGADTLQLDVVANAHHPAGDQTNSTIRITVPRVRIYTPAMGTGWTPG